jgi:hypothetical protein
MIPPEIWEYTVRRYVYHFIGVVVAVRLRLDLKASDRRFRHPSSSVQGVTMNWSRGALEATVACNAATAVVPLTSAGRSQTPFNESSNLRAKGA